MRKRMVEDDSPEILQLVYNYPDEIKKIVVNGQLEDFKQYVRYYDPITKDLIHAFIYCNYVIGKSGLFQAAEIADAILETLDVLDLSEAISLIEKIHILYFDAGLILMDTTTILVRLYMGTMTVNDVIEEEKQTPISDDFSKIVDKYLEYLEDGICFKDLYNMIGYDYNVFQKDRNKQTNIISWEDAIQKVKALYCSNHIYNKNHKVKGLY